MTIRPLQDRVIIKRLEETFSIVLLDRSYSMGYGDRWDRARAAARRTVQALNQSDHATLILFGTGWGLTDSLIDEADVLLPPIAGANKSGYNHLSVRAACAARTLAARSSVRSASRAWAFRAWRCGR